MEEEILFPEILSFGVQIEMKEVKISRAKRRRLKKKARRVLSIREDDGAVRSPVNQSVDGLSLCFDGLSPAIGVDVAMKKRNPEPFQVSDVLPVVEDEGSIDKLSDVLPVEDEDSIDKLSDVLPVEDEDSVKRKSVSPSEQLSPLVAYILLRLKTLPYHFVCQIISLPACKLPLFCQVHTCLMTKGLCVLKCIAQLKLSWEQKPRSRSKMALILSMVVAPRLKRKTRSKSIADRHRYNF